MMDYTVGILRGLGNEERDQQWSDKGSAEGRATMVCRQARLKFGPETAERLSQLLEGVTDPEHLARIGQRVIECETSADLLASARES